MGPSQTLDNNIYRKSSGPVIKNVISDEKKNGLYANNRSPHTPDSNQSEYLYFEETNKIEQNMSFLCMYHQLPHHYPQATLFIQY